MSPRYAVAAPKKGISKERAYLSMFVVLRNGRRYMVILGSAKQVPDRFNGRHCAGSREGGGGTDNGHFFAFAAFSARAAAPAVASRGMA